MTSSWPTRPGLLQQARAADEDVCYAEIGLAA